MDIVIILLALGLTGFSVFAGYVGPQNAGRVMIQGHNEKWIFPVSAEETVCVSGPLGETVIRLHEKEVWVDSSPCNNQTCVARGHVKSQGAWVACLPNNMFLIIIEGSDDPKNSPDAIAW